MNEWLEQRKVVALERIADAMEKQNELHEARNKTLKENSLPPMEPKK